MVQILVSEIKEDLIIPADINNPEFDDDGNLTGATRTVQQPAINEVLEVVRTGEPASISGNDILITPNTRFENEVGRIKIVEVDALPDNFKPNAFLYDGTTWTVNTSLTYLQESPTV